MAYKILFTKTAEKELSKLDKQSAIRIINFLKSRLSFSDNPKSLGKQLTGELCHYWRFRVGDYRIICDIQDDKLVILALRIGHRKEVYK
ncbi:type II toxin-antitoxin system RelE/ParE family toxin [Seleniivibrio sp.]|uniref:type II toxin-antitoxin system RelE family toxin n=1 Tax=Seleniivibrio sp. TaxID=2898801 RepID=UPI0025E4858F|nr:type II toxin-antitoxin system RelE/ParE family toxin [Seleniivibrio sp.]MCD8554121.1 type II toxin-antitoxin system RelE/ParE family toxin [Seleniivibrio sp.]